MPLHKNDTKACFHSHMGMWLMEPKIMGQMASAIRAGIAYEAKIADLPAEATQIMTIVESVAIIGIEGTLMKADSKFGGTSTIRVRQALRAAAEDDKITSILLHIDSPGGTVSGTKELADEVLFAKQSKPVHTFFEDLGASAAAWVGFQGNTVSANLTAQIGSLGVVAVVEDTSEMFERAGVKVHVISTGDFKGAGTQGTEITSEMLADMQETVNALHEVFMEAVVDGRNMSRADVDKIADGRVFLASKALELGLIDRVATFEEVLSGLVADGREKSRASRENRISNQLNQRR